MAEGRPVRIFVMMLAGLAAAACVHEGPKAQSLDALHTAHNWHGDNGQALDRIYGAEVRRILAPMRREGALNALGAAGYECIYGEGHADYPEPAAQCTYSFATRACQMDWEVFLTSDPAVPGGVDTLDGAFRRDCVGTDQDWPVPLRSAVDDQLAR